MLDLGANVFCDANVLYQFGVMGSVMAEQVDGYVQAPHCFAEYGGRSD